ncbi:hypothetical protein [Wolbachia endosymbiont (group A) of Colletes cunicularius]|uniref:hypothetical protein n=1 Tax=Wolbachia endosymbiont (group A) of Colletes cunicularius TaxID=3139321 RepID=UPI0035C8D9AA
MKVEVLLPEIEEGCCEGEDSKTEKELSSLIREYQKIKGQAARDRFNVLAESFCEGMQVTKEKVNKAERIQVANNLLILGVSIDVISQITGLSTDEIA